MTNDEGGKMINIFAGNYQQARLYAEENNLKRWRFISHVEALYGLVNPEVVKVGTYYERPDYERIEFELQRRGQR